MTTLMLMPVIAISVEESSLPSPGPLQALPLVRSDGTIAVRLADGTTVEHVPGVGGGDGGGSSAPSVPMSLRVQVDAATGDTLIVGGTGTAANLTRDGVGTYTARGFGFSAAWNPVVSCARTASGVPCLGDASMVDDGAGTVTMAVTCYEAATGVPADPATIVLLALA